MKKRMTALLALCLTLMLAACGMSAEEISATIETMQSEYDTGSYEDAYAHIEALDKVYGDMDDTQKSSYGTLRDSVKYECENIDAINASLSEIRTDLEQGLYYEANSVLEAVASTYTLAPTEQAAYDSYYAATDEGIRFTVVDNLLNAAMTAFNNNDYDTTVANLTLINEDIMTADEIQTRNLWLAKADELAKLQSAQSSYSSGNYTTAKNTLSAIDASLLSADQQTQYQQLVSDTDAKIEEANRITGAKAIALVKQAHKKKYGSIYSYDNLFYEYYDKGSYYLVRADCPGYLEGEDRYRVYKSNGLVEFVGSGSSWLSDDSEIGL